MSTTVRISDEARNRLGKLTEDSGQTQGEVIDEALERLERERYAAEFQDAYAKLREDEDAWEQEQKERAPWEATAGDGLEDEP